MSAYLRTRDARRIFLVPPACPAPGLSPTGRQRLQLPSTARHAGSRARETAAQGRVSVSERPVTSTFLTVEQAAEVRERFGTPCYVYDRRTLESTARTALDFPAPFGYTLRYAMKANPSIGILTLFRDLGLHIDASSDFEVERAIRAGFRPDQIQLTSQMPSRRLAGHVRRGVLFNACSLH